MGFYWENTLCSLLYSNFGKIVWIINQVIFKIGKKKGTFPQDIPRLENKMGTFSYPIPRLENKLEAFPKWFLDLRMKWEHFPLQSCCSVRELSLQCTTDSRSEPVTSRPHRIFTQLQQLLKEGGRPYWELLSPFFCITCLRFKSGLAVDCHDHQNHILTSLLDSNCC